MLPEQVVSNKLKIVTWEIVNGTPLPETMLRQLRYSMLPWRLRLRVQSHACIADRQRRCMPPKQGNKWGPKVNPQAFLGIIILSFAAALGSRVSSHNPEDRFTRET